MSKFLGCLTTSHYWFPKPQISAVYAVKCISDSDNSNVKVSNPKYQTMDFEPLRAKRLLDWPTKEQRTRVYLSSPYNPRHQRNLSIPMKPASETFQRFSMPRFPLPNFRDRPRRLT